MKQAIRETDIVASDDAVCKSSFDHVCQAVIHPDAAQDEAARLETLDRYALFSDKSSETFDRVVELAAQFIGVPSSAISLLTSDKQWFLARKGIEPEETPRQIAFCDHTIAQEDGLLVIDDAKLDPRFANNPLVTGPMGLRFYAGAALTVPSGQRLGALCVIDTKPRSLSGQERKVLAQLASIVVDEFELRRLLREQHQLIAQKDALALRLREQSEAAQRESERANRYAQSRSLFLANMSHEIRTPMNGLMGMAELLLQEPLSEYQADLASTLLQSAESLVGILNDVLDLSKLEEGCVRMESIAIQPSAIVSEVIRLQQSRPEAMGLQVFSRIKDIGARKGDPTRFRQILNNLLSNALKFSQQRPVFVHLFSLRERDGECLQELWSDTLDRCGIGFDGTSWPPPRWLSEMPMPITGDNGFALLIRDSGIGMNQAQLGRLGQAYSQADDSMTRRFGGTGLGLSICSKLVACMGGALGISSAEGQGTISLLVLSLPKADPPKTQVIDGCSPVQQRPLKILLAEDQDTNRKVAMAHLRALNCVVTMAENGLQALQAAQVEAFDLILMDIQMPVMSGIDAIDAIRKSDAPSRFAPIIALTASVMQHERDQVLRVGADQLLGKPYRRADLHALLSRWCYSGTCFDQMYWDENYSEFSIQDQQSLLHSALDSVCQVLDSTGLTTHVELRKHLHRLGGACSLVAYREAAKHLQAIESSCHQADPNAMVSVDLQVKTQRLLYALRLDMEMRIAELIKSQETQETHTHTIREIQHAT